MKHSDFNKYLELNANIYTTVTSKKATTKTLKKTKTIL